MQKKLVIAALATLAMGAVQAATINVPLTGTTTFVGTITDTPCVIDTGNSVGGLGQTVTLPNVRQDAFTGIGSTAGATGFNLQFSGCSATPGTAQVTFGAAGDTDAVDAQSFKNKTGGAAGVGFYLTDGGVNVVPGATRTFNLVSGSTTVPLSVAYRQTTTAITAGSVNTTLAVTVVFP